MSEFPQHFCDTRAKMALVVGSSCVNGAVGSLTLRLTASRTGHSVVAGEPH